MRVRYFAGAADAAGVTEEEVAAAPDLPALVGRLGAGRPELARVLAASTFLVDGRRAEPGSPLVRESVVDVLPPFAGG